MDRTFTSPLYHQAIKINRKQINAGYCYRIFRCSCTLGATELRRPIGASFQGDIEMLQAAGELTSREVFWDWYGVGHCTGHFGELVQGVFTVGRGIQIRGLVTLPCRKVGAVARAKISQDGDFIQVPDGKQKVRRVVESFKELHGTRSDISISIEIENSIPIGIGMGSSTADIVATIRALDQAFGVTTPDRDVVGLTLTAEAACDSTMLSQTVKIFAQRNGVVIEDFGRPFMPLLIQGFNLMPGQQFNTDEMPPAEYDSDEIACFDRLRNDLREALLAGSAERVSDISTKSAEINQRHYPKPNFDKLIALRERAQALGACISHSGTIAGLLYTSNRLPAIAERELIDAEGQEAGMVPLGVFRI
jgi:uncharacterized protein involved in propanediol utilization